MIDYSKWREAQLVVTTLLLDPYNPRIPDAGDELAQRQLLCDLIENEKVYDLAKSIVENGYYPNEALIYIEEVGKKYVVEGNRRLAALKLLHSPQAAPENWDRRFRALANRIDLKHIKKVKAIRAPSRDAAAPIIMARHTQNQIANWTPFMQAKFIQNLAARGLTIDDIAEQYKLRNSDVTKALRRYMLYTVACALDLPNDVAAIVHNPRKFNLTTLERLHDYGKVNEFLGVTFDSNKNLIGVIDPNEFKKGYTKIVTDIASGDAHSRTLNTYKEMDKYLAKFGASKPDLTKNGSFTVDALLKLPKKQHVVAQTSIKKRARPAPKPLKSLIPPVFSCDVNNQRINDVVKELKGLPVAQYPNAVGLMVRSLLEMSLGYYLDRTGHLTKIIDKEREKVSRKQKQTLPRDWTPKLKAMLQYLVSDEANIISNGNLLKALRKIIHSQDDIISIDTLNLFVHNQHFHPNEDTLRRFWSEFQDLFEILLVEPDDEGISQ